MTYSDEVKRNRSGVDKQQSNYDSPQASIAAAAALDYSTLPDLKERGPYKLRFIPLTLQDNARNRAVPTDLFLPEIPEATDRSIPILVLSHGWGHSRIYFRDVAASWVRDA